MYTISQNEAVSLSVLVSKASRVYCDSYLREEDLFPDFSSDENYFTTGEVENTEKKQTIINRFFRKIPFRMNTKIVGNYKSGEEEEEKKKKIAEGAVCLTAVDPHGE